MWRKIANSFTPGCCTCFYPANSTVKVSHLHLAAVLWQQKNILTFGPSALNICYPREIWSINREGSSTQAFATPAHRSFVLNKCNWFTFIIHECHRYVSFKLTAQSETILLLTSEEEQPEDRSQPPEVGSELFETRPFPETIAWWKLTTKYCLKYNGKTLCRSVDL